MKKICEKTREDCFKKTIKPLVEKIEYLEKDNDNMREQVKALGKFTDLLNSHIESQKTFEQRMEKLFNIVNDKLLPAYKNEIDEQNAIAFIRRKAKDGSFWIGILMSVIALFWAIISIIKQAIK